MTTRDRIVVAASFTLLVLASVGLGIFLAVILA